MNNKIFIPAGHSFEGDSNVRHPDGEILNIKRGYDQNSHVMPKNYTDVRKVLVDGVESSWGEYVPDSYDGSHPVPLVISRHGGGQSGWGQCYATSWCYVADREGFIVLYPDINPVAWAPPKPESGKRPSFNFQVRVPRDSFAIREMLAMIDEMKSKYNIDETRIFMQGMSMGDLMTMQFALACGSVLAGIGEAAGPANADQFFDEDGNPLPYETHVPAFVSFVSNNNAMTPPEQRPASQMDWKEMKNLSFWRCVDKAKPLPKIKIDGIENYVFYDGELAPVAYRDVLGRGHGQTFDDADMLWSTFFSGLRREKDGTITRTLPKESDYDRRGVAIAAGCRNAYVGSSLTDMGGEAYSVSQVVSYMMPGRVQEGQEFEPYVFNPVDSDSVMYVPARFLSNIGYKVNVSSCGKYASLTAPDGRRMEVSLGNVGVVIDGRIHSLERQVEERDGQLYLPIRWFAYEAGLYATQRDGVLYINDKHCEMTPNMAALIKEILAD